MLASHGSRFALPPLSEADLLALQEWAKGTGLLEMESKIKSEPLQAEESSHDDMICVDLSSSDSDDEMVSKTCPTVQ
jgi:hypothetical protein